MKKSWIWVLVIFAGSLPVGRALQYYFAGEAYRSTSTRNWLVIAQAAAGLVIMALGLYKQIRANRQLPTEDESKLKLDLND